MSRRSPLVRVVAFLALTAGVLAAQPPAPPTPPKAAGELRPEQEKNRDLFVKFRQQLLTLAQKLANSDKPEDKERAKVITAALDLARKEGVDEQFQRMVEALARGAKPGELEQITGQDAQLTKVLEEMLQILMTDDAATQLKQERERLEKLLAEARDILRQQKTVRAMTEAQRADPKQVAKYQAKVTDRTKELGKRMGGDPKEAKDAKGKGDPKDGKPGEPKDTKPKNGKPGDPKDGKPGDPKDGKPSDAKPKDGAPKPGQPKEGQPGEPKEGQPSPPSQSPPPPPQQLGRKQVQDAVPHQKKAEDALQKPDRERAAQAEEKAIKELEKAVAEMEKKLKQLREEEALKLLANLEARCARMLAMQTEVYEATKAIDAAVFKSNGAKSNADIQKAQQQADKELEIVGEAEKALKLLESEGSAVAFARILDEVRVDMTAVQKRLNDTFVGRDTQVVEESVIAMLKEMLAALKKAQQDQKNQPPPGGQAGAPPKPGDQRLIDLMAEIRLIRGLQLQVNDRTRVQGERYKGEQASDPIIQAELAQLSQRQQKLKDMVEKLSGGNN